MCSPREMQIQSSYSQMLNNCSPGPPASSLDGSSKAQSIHSRHLCLCILLPFAFLGNKQKKGGWWKGWKIQKKDEPIEFRLHYWAGSANLILINILRMYILIIGLKKSLAAIYNLNMISRGFTRPPYWSIGAGSTRPVTWAISSRTLNWNSWTNGSVS